MRAVYINAVGARSSRSKDVTATQAKPAEKCSKDCARCEGVEFCAFICEAAEWFSFEKAKRKGLKVS